MLEIIRDSSLIELHGLQLGGEVLDNNQQVPSLGLTAAASVEHQEALAVWSDVIERRSVLRLEASSRSMA
jgi:hypothetical protein